MKQIVLIVTLMISVSVFSQQPEKVGKNIPASTVKRKTHKAATVCLDSIVSPAVYKAAFSYDNEGNQTMYAHYRWENNAWIGNFKEECVYGNNENRIEEIFYSWNAVKKDWTESSKREYAYDANEYITLEIGYSWDTIENDWIKYSKDEYAYDTNRNILTSAFYTWDTARNDWKGSKKTDYTYDTNGYQILYAEGRWSNSTNYWYLFYAYKTEYVYNANRKPIIAEVFSWENSTWNLQYKTEYTYDTNENLILEIRCVNIGFGEIDTFTGHKLKSTKQSNIFLLVLY